MKPARAIELVGGILTALLGAALSLYVTRPGARVSDYLALFGVETCAALLVGVGAYAHVVSRVAWGRFLVWAGGAWLAYKAGALLLKVPVGLYFRGWVGLFLLLPGAAAVVTVVASLFSKRAAEG